VPIRRSRQSNAYRHPTPDCKHLPYNRLLVVGQPVRTSLRLQRFRVGCFFPANGKFDVMGGRDVNNVELTIRLNTTLAQQLDDQVKHLPRRVYKHMACAYLTTAGRTILLRSRSNFISQTGTGRVFRYDPTTVLSSPLPVVIGPARCIQHVARWLTVFNNTLVVRVASIFLTAAGPTDWQFTPNPAGWVQKNAVLPVPLGYLPTTTIGSLVYTGGGADITGGVLTDTTNAFVYDPVA